MKSKYVTFSRVLSYNIEFGTKLRPQKQVYYDFAEDSLDNGLRDTSKVDLSKPLNMAWIGPSLTPQGPGGMNPGWSYYEVDQKTFAIMNARTYFSDISKASSNWTVAPFKLEYDTRKEYDHKNTWPTDQPLDSGFWDRYLVQVIESNSTIAAAYNQYESRDSPTAAPCKTLSCIKYKKCSIQAGTAEAAILCQRNDPDGKTDPN